LQQNNVILNTASITQSSNTAEHINSNCRGPISAKDTKGQCSMYCYMKTSSCPEQKREPCYFMFFRINVAIVDCI
jgi:hypothetical protein